MVLIHSTTDCSNNDRNSNVSEVSSPDISRRHFLSMMGGIGALSILPTSLVAQSVGDIISTESFVAFQNRLQQYNSHDNWRPNGPNENRGNMWKYQTLAKPLIDGGLSDLDAQKLQYLIAQEVQSAYGVSQVNGFRRYNSNRIYDSNVFYGNIPGTPSIQELDGAVYDARLNGGINFDSPNEILRDLGLPNIQDDEDVAFVVKDANGLYCFIYYENGRLLSACPCSPGSTIFGAGAVTPSSGLEYNEFSNISHYFLDDDQKRRRGESEEEHRARLSAVIRSGDTVGGSMPYARRVLRNGRIDGYYTHTGNVNGRAASHGCIRLPAFWAYKMFYEANNEAKIHYRPEYYLRAEV